ncbi:MAG: FumA C-terminus/TtdB family hydratase beta subunit [Spirochaetes bacterium]|nr:FumA C-terminus/TtdB family hydratase beta subunit [Spirochaetota bacterium]
MTKIPGEDPFTHARYRKVEGDYVRTRIIDGCSFLQIDPLGIQKLAKEAFQDVSFFLRPSFLEKLNRILLDPEASANDRYVAETLLQNAVVAAEGFLPLCQDTGTATVIAWKGDRVWVQPLVNGGIGSVGESNLPQSSLDEEALWKGIEEVYRTRYLRYSQIAPITMFEEVNTGTNLPPQIDIYASEGTEYRFLFIAKGAGSANKTSFFQESRALLEPEKLRSFLREKVRALGTAACPPYRLAVVIGGLSPEMNLKVLKLATTGLLDRLPEQGDGKEMMYLDREWSGILLQLAQESGLGAQFGGKYLALDARVIRIARHAGACPVSIGVSCSADRNILGRITQEGMFLEQLEKNPSRFLKDLGTQRVDRSIGIKIDLDRSLDEVRKDLSKLPVGSLVLLSGPLVVARDIAHARFFKRLQEGKGLPDYLYRYGVYYAGPAKTPPGYPIGSFGPTTAQRMDSYLEAFMREGASLVTLAKGNRAKSTVELCRTFGGFYLGTIGGAAALLAKEHIVSSEVLDYPDLDMEAVRLIWVKDFPAFILIDDKGNDLYGLI